MSVAVTATASPHAYLQAQARWHRIEIVFWLATLLPFWLFPDYLVLASQIAITALFALSLDLILGYAGIVSLGHAAFFGLGAYTAGLISKYGWGEPISGLLLGALVAGIVGYAASFIVVALPPSRADHDHARHGAAAARGGQQRELAHRRRRRAAGREDVADLQHLPLRSLRQYRLHLFADRAVSRVSASRGASSIRRSASRCAASARIRVRMPALGAPSRAHLRKIYTISAVIAGIAGALLAQTTETVSLEVLGFQRSADVLVILILGGAGRLYGGLDRRDHLHGGARPVLRQHAAVLVLLDRHAADRWW